MVFGGGKDLTFLIYYVFVYNLCSKLENKTKILKSNLRDL